MRGGMGVQRPRPSGLRWAERARPGLGGRTGTRSARPEPRERGRKIPSGCAWGGEPRDTRRIEEGKGKRTE